MKRIFILASMLIASASFAADMFLLTPLNRTGNTESADLYNYAYGNIAVRTEWSAIEPAAHQYDWSYLDEAVGIASSAGRKVSIAVVTEDTPQWVFNLGAQPFGTHNYPPPWDPVFLKHWKELIHHLARRYDGNPALAYITIGGPGYLEEGYLSHSRSDQQYYDSQGWLSASRKIARYYKNSFHQAPVYLAFGPQPVPGYSGDMQSLADYAKLIGIGLKLNNLSSWQPATGDMQYNEVSSSDLPTCFQFVGPAKSYESFGAAVDRALSLGAGYVEFYYGDLSLLKVS